MGVRQSEVAINIADCLYSYIKRYSGQDDDAVRTRARGIRTRDAVRCESSNGDVYVYWGVCLCVCVDVCAVYLLCARLRSVYIYVAYCMCIMYGICEYVCYAFVFVCVTKPLRWIWASLR